MNAHDFDDGDGFYTPYKSGYEVLHEAILEDMEENPWRYKRWEVSLLKSIPQDSYAEYWLDVYAYIDHWCEENSEVDVPF